MWLVWGLHCCVWTQTWAESGAYSMSFRTRQLTQDGCAGFLNQLNKRLTSTSLLLAEKGSGLDNTKMHLCIWDTMSFFKCVKSHKTSFFKQILGNLMMKWGLCVSNCYDLNFLSMSGFYLNLSEIARTHWGLQFGQKEAGRLEGWALCFCCIKKNPTFPSNFHFLSNIICALISCTCNRTFLFWKMVMTVKQVTPAECLDVLHNGPTVNMCLILWHWTCFAVTQT